MKQKGFTLLEILLVIAAIGILASIVIVAINPGRQLAQARNAERKQEVGTIYSALQQYVIETGSYPAGITGDYQEICRENPVNDCIDLLDLSSVLVPTYLASIPEDPIRTGSDDPDDGTGYQVRVVGDVASLGVMTSEESEVIAVNDPTYVPGGGPSGPLFEDAFTVGADTPLASHTPDTGTGWTEVWSSSSTTAQVFSSGGYVGPTAFNNDDGMIFSADAASYPNDYSVQVTLGPTITSTAAKYVLARMTDQDNYFALQLRSSTEVVLYKKVSGATSQLSLVYDSTAWQAGDVAELEVSGSTIRVLKNDTELINVTDADLASGQPGLAWGGGSELIFSSWDLRTQQQFDRFLVEAL